MDLARGFLESISKTVAKDLDDELSSFIGQPNTPAVQQGLKQVVQAVFTGGIEALNQKHRESVRMGEFNQIFLNVEAGEVVRDVEVEMNGVPLQPYEFEVDEFRSVITIDNHTPGCEVHVSYRKGRRSVISHVVLLPRKMGKMVFDDEQLEAIAQESLNTTIEVNQRLLDMQFSDGVMVMLSREQGRNARVASTSIDPQGIVATLEVVE